MELRLALEKPIRRHAQLYNDAAERSVPADVVSTTEASPFGRRICNGAVNTLLSNNIITTQITPELANKASYRYYNYDNSTPQLLFPNWVSLDRVFGVNTETAIQALVLSYNKQNAGDELVWRPTREWTVGAAYGYERYNWTNYVAAATNENSGKVFADWKPTSWFTLRSSAYFSDRRSVNYDLASFTNNQFPDTDAGNGFKFSPSYRMLMIDNRERWKANVAFDMVVAPGVLITPTFKYQDDNYGLNPANQLGLTDARSWGPLASTLHILSIHRPPSRLDICMSVLISLSII